MSLHHHHHHQRVSAYDNLSGSAGDLEAEEEDDDDDDDVVVVVDDDDDMSDNGTVTEFSEPWDSSRWDRLLSSPSNGRKHPLRNSNSSRSLVGNAAAAVVTSVAQLISPLTSGGGGGVGVIGHSKSKLSRTRSFKDKMDPLMASPRLLALRSACNSQSGRDLQALVLKLGADHRTTFGRSLQHFLQCTREAKEQRSAAVLRNVRQFISGMKNFLIQHGESTFDTTLLDIRAKLKSNEFLNVDVVLELVLHQLVTLPLRSRLFFVSKLANVDCNNDQLNSSICS